MMIQREQGEKEILRVVDALTNAELGGDAAFLLLWVKGCLPQGIHQRA